jgi:hypothetical protein
MNNLAIPLGTIIHPAFSGAIGRLVEQPIPVRCGYWLQKVRKTLAEEAQGFETQRQAIIQRHGFSAEGVAPSPDAAAAADHEFQELLKIQVELPIDRKLTLHVNDQVHVSVADLDALEPILEILE